MLRISDPFIFNEFRELTTSCTMGGKHAVIILPPEISSAGAGWLLEWDHILLPGCVALSPTRIPNPFTGIQLPSMASVFVWNHSKCLPFRVRKSDKKLPPHCVTHRVPERTPRTKVRRNVDENIVTSGVVVCLQQCQKWIPHPVGSGSSGEARNPQ